MVTLRPMATSLPPETLATLGLRIVDLAFRTGLEERGVDHLRRATDVERTHGELGARLADRLGGDDAHRFADIDRRAASEVATVAGGAATLAQIAGQRRADLDRLDPGGLDERRRPSR